MITGTVFLIMAIFGGGITSYFSIAQSEAEIFTLKNVEKNIRAQLNDPEREEEVLAIFKEAKMEIKSLKKQLNVSGKAFKKLQPQQDVDQRELEAIFRSSEVIRKNVQQLLVDKRLRIRNLLSQQEWERFVAKGLQEIEDNPKKYQKAQQDIKDADSALLRKLKRVLEKKIRDPERMKTALTSYEEFRSKLNRLTEESIEYTENNNQTVRAYNTNRSVLEEVFSELNESRIETFMAFLEMRMELAQILPEKEWKSIARAFNKML